MKTISLPSNHPGINDQTYIDRRNHIANAAQQYKESGVIPLINYTEQEHNTWKIVCNKLLPLHESKACKIYLEGREQVGISTERIPEFREINESLKPITGFQIAPVGGLVDSKTFLSEYTKRQMLCTQFIRHHSEPKYTPEPDIVHEIIGHVPGFTNEAYVQFLELMGRAAQNANKEQMAQLNRLHWWTVEFALIRESNDIKVFGAGILSSFGEMEHAFEVPHHNFNLEICLNLPFDYANMQDKLFIIDSFEDLLQKTHGFLEDMISNS